MNHFQALLPTPPGVDEIPPGVDGLLNAATIGELSPCPNETFYATS